MYSNNAAKKIQKIYRKYILIKKINDKYESIKYVDNLEEKINKTNEIIIEKEQLLEEKDSIINEKDEYIKKLMLEKELYIKAQNKRKLYSNKNKSAIIIQKSFRKFIKNINEKELSKLKSNIEIFKSTQNNIGDKMEKLYLELEAANEELNKQKRINIDLNKKYRWWFW